MEEKHEKQESSTTSRRRHPPPPQQHQPPPSHVSKLEPVTHGAYGGGMYGTEEGDRLDPADDDKKSGKPPASNTQSADGPEAAEAAVCKHKPPPSSGDRDIDITGQSYIQ